jgi:ABC-2 type transport system ATP-binding protein
MSDFAIETERLEKTYRMRFRTNREIRALADVSLRVPRGVKFGLLGANGAGKTTFVKVLVSAVLASSGSALLFGRDARDPEARLPVGYLPENHRFPTYFTGRGMLDFYGSLSGMEIAERRKRIPELLERVGLKDWADVRIKKYSKGMLQRLGLAQALMHRPQLLLLDEPTDGVDPVGRREIRDILNSLTGTGVTVFINSHLLSEVEAFCDYVAILKRGELALEGKISNLVAGRGYRIVASSVPDALLKDLRQSVSSIVRAPEHVEIGVATREEANATIDRLRSAGALIENLTASTSSLEDVFIQTTRAGTEAA